MWSWSAPAVQAARCFRASPVCITRWSNSGHPGGIDCTVFDDDTVSPTNVGRQGFYPNDVGEYKASLIVNRLNALMGTDWRAETRRFGASDPLYNVDLVIGCVDTRAARRAIVRRRRKQRASTTLTVATTRIVAKSSWAGLQQELREEAP